MDVSFRQGPFTVHGPTTRRQVLLLQIHRSQTPHTLNVLPFHALAHQLCLTTRRLETGVTRLVVRTGRVQTFEFHFLPQLAGLGLLGLELADLVLAEERLCAAAVGDDLDVGQADIVVRTALVGGALFDAALAEVLAGADYFENGEFVEEGPVRQVGGPGGCVVVEVVVCAGEGAHLFACEFLGGDGGVVAEGDVAVPAGIETKHLCKSLELQG